MMDDDIRALAEVDAALREWPVTRAPESLAPTVMARVRALAAPKLRFTLTWLDFALPMFGSAMFAVAATLWFRIPAQQWAYFVAETRWLWLVFEHQLELLAVNPSALYFGLMALAALGATAWFVREPSPPAPLPNGKARLREG